METGKENTRDNTTLGYKAGATVGGCGGLIGSGDTRTVLSDGTIIDRGDMVECLEPPAGDQFYVWKYEGQKSQIGKKGKFGSVGMFGSILVVYIEGMEHIWPLCSIRKCGSSVAIIDATQVDVLFNNDGVAITARDWNPADKHEIKQGRRVKLYSWCSPRDSVVEDMCPSHHKLIGKIAIVLDVGKLFAQVKTFDAITYWPLEAMRLCESDGKLHLSTDKETPNGDTPLKAGLRKDGYNISTPNEQADRNAQNEPGLSADKELPDAPDIVEATDSNGRTIKLKDRVRLLQDPTDSDDMRLTFVGTHAVITCFFYLSDGVRCAGVTKSSPVGGHYVPWPTRSLVYDPIDDNPQKLTASDMSRSNEIKQLKQQIQDTKENRDSDKHLYASRLSNLRKSLTTVRRANPDIEF